MAFQNSLRKTSEKNSSGQNTTPEMLQAYRDRGWQIPLFGILTVVLFCLVVPVWYDLFVGKLTPSPVLVIGILFSVLAVPLHALASSRKYLREGGIKPLLYVIGILLNSLGASICMTAYYLHIGAEPASTLLFAGTLIAVGLYFLTALFMQIRPARYPLITGLAALITLLLMVAAVILWIRNDNKLFFSFVFFNLLWVLISAAALHVACADETSPCLRFASFASFGILIGVAAIVLVILACAGGDCDCDCDCGDGCCDCGDCHPGDENSKLAKRKNKNVQ